MPDLSELVLLEGLTVIEEEAFAGCGAAKIVILCWVTEIRSRSFANCPNLRIIEFLGWPNYIAKDYLKGSSNARLVAYD